MSAQTGCESTREASRRTGDESVEEWLAGEISIVGLEVLLGGSDELHGNELESSLKSAHWLLKTPYRGEG